MLAIVAALIGAVAVIGGVVLAQRFTEKAQHQRELNQRVRAIQERLMSLLSITDGVRGEIDEQWVARSTAFTNEVAELRSFVTVLSKSRRNKIDAACREIGLRWIALLTRIQDGMAIREPDEYIAMFGAVTDLNVVSGRALDHDPEVMRIVRWYTAEGIDAGPPPSDWESQ